MRTTRCYRTSLDRAGSGDDPTSASRREHRDELQAQHWRVGLVKVPPGLGFRVPSLGVSPLEGTSSSVSVGVEMEQDLL